MKATSPVSLSLSFSLAFFSHAHMHAHTYTHTHTHTHTRAFSLSYSLSLTLFHSLLRSRSLSSTCSLFLSLPPLLLFNFLRCLPIFPFCLSSLKKFVLPPPSSFPTSCLAPPFSLCLSHLSKKSTEAY